MHFFEWFSVNISITTWLICMKLGQKWVRIDTKMTQKTRCQNLEPIWRYQASNSQKSTQNRPKFMDDPKNFRKNFFGLNASKWSNSKSYHVKSEIRRPSKNFPLLGHHSWRLRKFRTSQTSWSNPSSWTSETSWTSQTSQTSWTCGDKSRSFFWSWGQVPQGRYSSQLLVEL